MPGAVTLTGFWPVAKPVQVIVAPLVVDAAVRFTVVVVQVNTAGCDTVRLGFATSCVTVTLAVVEQPFAVVAVAVYVPGAFTLTGFWPVAKPIQVIVAPLVVDAAVRFTEIVVHVNTAGCDIVRFGLALSCVTVTLSFCVQPLLPVATA